MLRSYFTSATRGRVVLRREVLSQLGMGPEGVLYGTLCPDEQTAILSPIPPRYWESALKIIVQTKHLPGSLAAVAKAIASLKLDTISSWASNASFSGHLCSTSIVVADPAALDRLGDESGIVAHLSEQVQASLSDLRVLEDGSLLKVRVTPLSILSAYSRSLASNPKFSIPVNQHSMTLSDSVSLVPSQSQRSLWDILQSAGDIKHCASCILTPDTEEALLRVTPISEHSRLCRMSFNLKIDSHDNSFAGYWQSALDELGKWGYSIYLAHNLIISKTELPPFEEAHFHFVLDYRGTHDVGYDLGWLRGTWTKRLQKAFGVVASPRGDAVQVSRFQLSRPRGVGAPCFVSTNAKTGEGARAAAELCRLLEGYGFRPVNVDRSLPKAALRDQVLKLVRACRFMVVLYCPEKRLELETGRCRVSDWVFFEENIMEAKGGDIYRFRFPNVDPPATSPGFPETVLDGSGFSSSSLGKARGYLEGWQRRAVDGLVDIENSADPERWAEHFAHDLVSYYEEAAGKKDEYSADCTD